MKQSQQDTSKVFAEEDLEINVDSLWVLGPRAKGGKRENNYHGNFAPQIPSDVIRRFTQEDDIVVEPFMGSGTTLFECERLKRRYVGFDINESIVDYVNTKMQQSSCDFKIHLMDAGSEKAAKELKRDLDKFNRETADLLILHPPYFDIIIAPAANYCESAA